MEALFRRVFLIWFAYTGVCLCVPLQKAEANAKVKRATRYYLSGLKAYSRRKYSRAIRAFERAAKLLPRHPHFNCHRTKFYNYIGKAYEKKRSPHRAMGAYKKARSAGCRRGGERRHAARRYAALYRRWICSIRITTKPNKARVYMLTRRQDKFIGYTPLKRVLKPGRYKFKIRLFDHKTQFFNVRLRPGRHLKKRIAMLKGDDPILNKEKPNIAPPPPMSALLKKAPKKDEKKKEKEKDIPFTLLNDKK